MEAYQIWVCRLHTTYTTNRENMIYTYDVVLHNAATITIAKACQLAETIQDHIQANGTHVQGVTAENKSVTITIETSYQLKELFTVIYDNRPLLGYSDFSIYYAEDYTNVTSSTYAW